MRYPASEVASARRQLLSILSPGMCVHTILRSGSEQGKSKRISIILLQNDNYLYLTVCVATMMGLGLDAYRMEARVKGNMIAAGYTLIRNLSSNLWPDGFTCSGNGCPSQEHREGDRYFEPHHHADSANALRQMWL